MNKPVKKSDKVILTFTCNSVDAVMSKGGDGDWHLDPNRARNCQYLVCCSSVGARRGYVFLIGKINGIEFSKLDEKGQKRYVIQISEWAEFELPNKLWPGYQNPVYYTTLDNLNIDISTLEEKFKKISKVVNVSDVQSHSLTIAQAKAGLAQHYGVSHDSIEIIIKG